MNISPVAIIPSRLESSRVEKKALVDICGIYGSPCNEKGTDEQFCVRHIRCHR